MRSYRAAPPAQVVTSNERALPASGARSYRTDQTAHDYEMQWTWRITNAPSLPYLRSQRIAAGFKLTTATIDYQVLNSAAWYVQCLKSVAAGAQPDASILRELWLWWQQCRRIIGSQPTPHVEDGAWWGLTEYVAYLLDVELGGPAPPATLQSSPLLHLLQRQGDQWRHRVGPHLRQDDEPLMFTVEGDAAYKMYWSQAPYSYAGHYDCVVDLIAGHDHYGEPIIKRLPSYLVQPAVSPAWVRPFQYQGPYSLTQIISQCLYHPESPLSPGVELEQMLLTANTPLVEQLAAKAVYAALSSLGYSRRVDEVRMPVDDESDPVIFRLESTQSTDIQRAKRAFRAQNYHHLEIHSTEFVCERDFAKQIAQEFARAANRQWIPLSDTGLALL